MIHSSIWIRCHTTDLASLEHGGVDSALGAGVLDVAVLAAPAELAGAVVVAGLVDAEAAVPARVVRALVARVPLALRPARPRRAVAREPALRVRAARAAVLGTNSIALLKIDFETV